MSDQQRTRKVLALIQAGLDQKLQSGAHEQAQRHLDRAYELARDPAPLSSPWPEITAYRSAHMAMRRGADTDWCRVDALLKEACAGDILGLAPQVYRLISLSKGGAPSDQLAPVYEQARRALERHPSATGLPRNYAGDDRPIQSEWLNLLELAVYVTGLDYRPLQGRGGAGEDVFADLGFGSSAWRVIEGPESATIAYPEPIARQRFRDRRDALQPCVAIESSGSRTVKAFRAGNQMDPVSMRPQEACDLLSLMTGRREHRQTGLGSVAGDSNASARQRRHRLRQALEGLGMELGQQALSDWWEAAAPAGPPDSFPPILMLVGPGAWPSSRRRPR